MKWRKVRGKRKWLPVVEPPAPPPPPKLPADIRLAGPVPIVVDGSVWMPSDPPRPCPLLLTEAEALLLLRLDGGPAQPLRTLAYYRQRHGLRRIDAGGQKMYRRADLLGLVDRLAACRAG